MNEKNSVITSRDIIDSISFLFYCNHQKHAIYEVGDVKHSFCILSSVSTVIEAARNIFTNLVLNLRVRMILKFSVKCNT